MKIKTMGSFQEVELIFPGEDGVLFYKSGV